MERNMQELDCVSIPAIACYHRDKLTALSLAVGKLVLKLEYQCILITLGMEEICDGKRTREMPKQSSATRSFICWGRPAEKTCCSLRPCEHDPHHSYSKQGKPLQSPSASLWCSFIAELKAV